MALPQPPVEAIRWEGDAATGQLCLIDQTRLPVEEVWLERQSFEDVVEDIQRLAVRGAPAIGLAGAYALVLAARDGGGLEARAETIAKARPTAVNLRTAVRAALAASKALDRPPAERPAALLAFARDLEAYEREACDRIAEAGAAWLGSRHRILTHCNAGALVTPGLGTALAPIYLMHAEGKPVHVWVDETRPLLQGLRLTAYELGKGGVSHQVLVEGAAPGLMRRGEVDAVIVGADRVCRNGDVTNKVGTYGVALSAHRHGIPFLVAAPISTLDPETPTGDDVRIEQRPADGLLYLREDAARPVEAFAPAFDVTPADLVTALVTDRGVLETPTTERLGPWMAEAARLQAGTRVGR